MQKNIIQTYKLRESENPLYIKSLVETWKFENHDWSYVYLDDESAYSLVKKTSETLAKAFKITRNPQVRGDITRAVAAYWYGGFYADIDTVCYVPLSKLFDPSLDVVLPINMFLEQQFWFDSCGFSAKHKILKTFLCRIEKNCEKLIAESCPITPHSTSFAEFTDVVWMYLFEQVSHDETSIKILNDAKNFFVAKNKTTEEHVKIVCQLNSIKKLNDTKIKFYDYEFMGFNPQFNKWHNRIPHVNASSSWKDCITDNEHYFSNNGKINFSVLNEFYRFRNMKAADIKVLIDDKSYWT